MYNIIFSRKEEVGKEVRGNLHKDFGAVESGLLGNNTQEHSSLSVSGHKNGSQGQSTKCK